MTDQNALLNALHLFIQPTKNGRMVGKCRELPHWAIHAGKGNSTSELFANLRKETVRRLESGCEPKFYGTGGLICDICLYTKKTQCLSLTSLHDSWCGMSDEKLARSAEKVADRWIQKVGPRISKNDRTIRVTKKSLSALICLEVKAGRKSYMAEKSKWEKSWEAAKIKRQQELKEQEMMCSMVAQLVEEALCYVEKGGRLKDPWAVRERRGTPAETWHLMNFDQFNARAESPKEHREEKKNAEGSITRVSIRYENQGGGETAAAGEQTEFLIQGLASQAEKGDENALRWLHRLALVSSALFWSSVERQQALAKCVSKEWNHVPMAFSRSPASIKEAQARIVDLNMPEPQKVDLKVEPRSQYHRIIGRIGEAINFLMRVPPASTPWTGVHESAPQWLKNAWQASHGQTINHECVPDVYWAVYEAAMTRKADSPWRMNSRPRKEREKFLKAVHARLPKQQSSAKTP